MRNGHHCLAILRKIITDAGMAIRSFQRQQCLIVAEKSLHGPNIRERHSRKECCRNACQVAIGAWKITTKHAVYTMSTLQQY